MYVHIQIHSFTVFPCIHHTQTYIVNECICEVMDEDDKKENTPEKSLPVVCAGAATE